MKRLILTLTIVSLLAPEVLAGAVVPVSTAAMAVSTCAMINSQRRYRERQFQQCLQYGGRDACYRVYGKQKEKNNGTNTNKTNNSRK